MSETVTQAPAPGTVPRPPADKIAWVNKNLRVAFPGLPPPAPPPPAPPPPSPAGRQITYAGIRDSKAAWDKMRKTVQSQLENLEAAILNAVKEHNQDGAAQDSFDASQVAGGIKNLYGILDKLDLRLIAALDRMQSAQGGERGKAQDAVRSLVAEYRAYVQSDPLVAMIDKNGFMATMIKQWFDHTMSELSENL